VCDYRAGELRGYLKFDAERLAEVGPDPTLFALFGEGFLAITFDQATTAERYQGIVPLEGASIGEAAEHYFEQSEQISSLIKLAAATMPRRDASRAGCCCSIFPRVKLAATGCTFASTIPNGSMSACWARRSAAAN
jgi:molecular chaperone Hsp33